MKFKLKLLVAKKLDKIHIKLFKAKLSKYYQIIIPKKFIKQEIISLAKDSHICIGTSSQEYLINKSHKIKVFQNIGSGIDGFDLESFKKRKILLGKSNENALLVAEYATSVLMTLIKNLNIYLFKSNKNDYINKLPTNILTKKKIGIIGYGNIGKNIVKLLVGFDNLFYVKTNQSRIKETANIKSKEIDYILNNSDIIFISVPLTNNTLNLINNKNYKKINNKTIIINLSRSEIFQLSALKKLISKKNIKISFDSNYKEKNKSEKFDLLLKENKNLFFTPYIAALDEIGSYPVKLIIENLIYYSNNKKLKYSIDYKKGY